MDDGVVAEVIGARPWGHGSAISVPLREGDVYRVGRLDRPWLRRTAMHQSHLALGPNTRATVSAISLTLVANRFSVDITSSVRLADALVDGRPIGRETITLQGPRHEIVIDPAGVPQPLLVLFPRTSASPPTALPSGSTVVPVFTFAGHRLTSMAAALVWPMLPDVVPPIAGGWSSAEIVARHVELWGTQPTQPRRTLHDLRALLVEARSSDGRLMITVAEAQPWPWPQRYEDSGFATPQAFIEGKNRLVAVHLAASGQFTTVVSSALERVR